MRKLPAQPVEGLIDGLRVLQELALRKEPVSGLALARELGMEPTRMNRLLKTLDFLGMADRTSDRRYQSGPGIHVLAAQALAKSKLLQKAAAPLDEIPAPGCIKAIGVLWRDKMSYLMHRGPEMGLLESLGALQDYPASRSSLGMALLARLDDSEIKALYEGREIPQFASFSSFMKEIERTRKRGFGLLETAPGNWSLAFAVGEPALGAIALSGKMDERKSGELAELLRVAAKKASAALDAEEA